MNLHGRIRPLFASRRHASASRLTLRPGFDQLEPRLAFAVGYATANDWGSGLQGQLTLVNDTSTTLTDWQLSFTYSRAIASIWNAQIVSHIGTQYVIKGFDWNRTIAVGGTQGVGFTAGAGTDSPTNFVLTAGGGVTPAPTLPTLSVAGITVSEGPVGGTTAARFTVTLSKASTIPVTVNYATAAGTATAGSDYTTTSGSLSFAAGETTKTVPVTVLGDAAVEPDETFTLVLTSPTNATLAAATATATITNDDVAPPTPPVAGGTDLWKEQFFAPYVDMGQYPVPDLDGLARRYGVGLLTLGFMQASPGGKLAWAGLDALALDGTHEQAIAIRTEIDSLRAAGGDVMVSLGGAAGQSLAQYYAQRGLGTQALAAAYAQAVDTLKLTKLDFDIEGAAVAEPLTLKLQMDAIAIVQQGRPGLGVWLTLPVLPQGLTQDGINVVRAALTAGVKVDGVNVMAMDYGDSAAPPQLKSMGEYAIDAANATFTQMTSLFAGFGQPFGWNQLGVTPMLGLNDVATEVFTLQDADRLETFARSKGLGMLSMWSLNRDNPGPSGQLSNVHCGLPGITAGGFSTTWGDYGSDPVLSGGTPPATPLPGISVGDASVAEGNPEASGAATTLVFTVSLSAASTQIVTVQYATADGTAVKGGDYVAAAGMLSFSPGETVKTVTVTVVRDTTSEPNETVALSLTGPTNAVLARAFAVGTILDDDTAAAAPANDVAVTYTQTTAWGTGFNGAIRIKNTGTTTITGWTIEFDMKATIVNIWNAVIVSHVGTRYVIKNADWNASIAPGAEISFGFQAEGLAGELPTNKKFNGRSVR